MSRAALLAEKMNQQPGWFNLYDQQILQPIEVGVGKPRSSPYLSAESVQQWKGDAGEK